MILCFNESMFKNNNKAKHKYFFIIITCMHLFIACACT